MEYIVEFIEEVRKRVKINADCKNEAMNKFNRKEFDFRNIRVDEKKIIKKDIKSTANTHTSEEAKLLGKVTCKNCGFPYSKSDGCDQCPTCKACGHLKGEYEYCECTNDN